MYHRAISREKTWEKRCKSVCANPNAKVAPIISNFIAQQNTMTVACGSLVRVATAFHQAPTPGPAVRTRTCAGKPVNIDKLVGHQLRVSSTFGRVKGKHLQGAFSGVRTNRGEVECMAHPKRVARVQQQLKREISTLFVHDKVTIYSNHTHRCFAILPSFMVR